MAILLLTGVPGSTKSATGVKRFMIPSLKEGRKVYHNIRGVNLHTISAYLDMEYHQLKKLLIYIGEEDDQVNEYFEKVEPLSMTIIDEAHEYMSGQKYKELSHLKRFISLHRHYGNDVVLITQHVEDLWTTIQRRIEQTYVLRKHPTKEGTFQSFTYVGFKVEGKHLVEKDYKPDPEIFKLYQSTQLDEEHQEKNLRVRFWEDKRIRRTLYIYGSILLAVVYYISRNGIPLLNRYDAPEETEVKNESNRQNDVSTKTNTTKNDIKRKIGEFQNIQIPYTNMSCRDGYCEFTTSDGQKITYPQFMLHQKSEFPIRYNREYQKK